MSNRPKIVNVTATARFGQQIDLQRIEYYMYPVRVTYDPYTFAGAQVHLGHRVTVSIFSNGKAVAVGARSPSAAKAAFVLVARQLVALGARVREFKVVNMCASWYTNRPQDSITTQRLTSPRAYVRVTPRGGVLCMGVTSRVDLKRVHALIH